MLEVAAGIVVALAALALVLEPLLRREYAAASAIEDDDDADVIALEETDSSKIRALLALREIEFDRATGKLSDDDYASLKAKYSAVAVAAIHAEDREAAADAAVHSTGSSVEDVAEAAVQRARRRGRTACPICGPRPEADAVFCSDCGRSLTNPEAAPRCWICGAPVPPEAKYCPSCGKVLAA
jgi:predicted nucleic acid-binding Zn ribbon protein